MQCTTHIETLADGTCTYSGKPFCKDCLIEIEGKLFGKPYLDKAVSAMRDQAAAKAQPNVYMNAGGAAAAIAAPTIIMASKPPFYRRRWFCIIFIGPITLIILLTGPIFWHSSEGMWTRTSVVGKWVYAILSCWFLAAL
jgi:hypothetical protein